MSSLESWAYLNRVVEGPSQHIQALLRAGRTAQEIAHGVRTRATWIGGLAAQTENRYTWDRPAEDLEAAAQQGFTLLTPESDGWPTDEIAEAFDRGRAVAAAEGRTVPADAVAPHGLWVRGNTDLAALLSHSVAFVGTRAASTYGHHATANLVNGLAQHRYTIVSGGAYGVDTVAHRTALDAGLPTVVVAAGGPGNVYPAANRDLFEQITASGGSWVTEYPPGTAPERHRFLTRNRLVAALTQGTVLTEAAFRSGALNTLTWVNAFNRAAMAVPGPILGAQSLGTNLAIRDERALMVLNAGMIHERLSRVGEFDAEAQLEMDFAADPIQQLSRNELRIYDALPPAGHKGRQAEDIASASGLTIALTVHILMDLQKRAMVVRDGRLWSRTQQGE